MFKEISAIKNCKLLGGKSTCKSCIFCKISSFLNSLSSYDSSIREWGAYANEAIIVNKIRSYRTTG